MTRRTVAVALLALCGGLTTGVALGRQSVGAEVRRLHQVYYDYFADGRADLIAERIYHPNRMSFGAGGVTIAAGRDEVEAGFRSTTDRLRTEGYDHSELVDPVICTPNAGTAILSGRFRRYRTDGTVMLESAQTYIYGRTDDGWRIHATIAHDPAVTVGCLE